MKKYLFILLILFFILIAYRFFPSVVLVQTPGTLRPVNQTIDHKNVQKAKWIVAAAGDIACGNRAKQNDQCQQEATAKLIEQINPNAVLILGDIQYDGATFELYNKYYHPSWGKFKNITYPSLGNHEYESVGASGYFSYFGTHAGEKGEGYYSFNLGSWHIIALNSNCGNAGGCGFGSSQYKWLENDLKNNTAACTLAFWHHPLFSSGPHGNNMFVQDFWKLLYQNNVDLVLNGHDHLYERFKPLDPQGKVDPEKGIRVFIVGTGGRNLYQFKNISQNSESRYSQGFGVLKLTLEDLGYQWQYLPVSGNFTDSGSAVCR